MDQQLLLRQEEFSTIDFIKLAVCTWNMGGVKPYDDVNLKEWLLPGVTNADDAPDILVVGIQQIIPNKKSSMFNKNKDRLVAMQNNIMAVLNANASQASYTLVRTTDQHGLFILVIAKAEI